LQLNPVGASTQMAAPSNTANYAQPVYAQPVYEQPTQVIVAPPVYPNYYARPSYPPVSLEFDLGYGDGYRGHRHWR